MSLSWILCRFQCVISNVRNASKSDFKWADGTGTYATYGHCATKSLGTFFGFRGTLITTAKGVPVDFAIASADRDDRDVLPYLVERGEYPMILGDKVMSLRHFRQNSWKTQGTVLLPTLRSNQKRQYP